MSREQYRAYRTQKVRTKISIKASMVFCLLLSLIVFSVMPVTQQYVLAADSQIHVEPIVLPDVDPVYKNASSTVPDKLVPPSGPIPTTGFAPDTPAYKKLDKEFCALMRKWDLPGGSLCIAKNGKIIMSRGYGWSDIRHDIKVQPASLFRIASISKALTAVAIAKLCEEKKLQMETRAFDVLSLPWPNETRRDPRISDITVRDLLQCTAGWDRSKSGDPLFSQALITAADKYSHSLRPTPRAIVRLWMERPLDSLPGTHFAYSNLCYTVLGLLVEKVSGMHYEDYVKAKILAPMGITRMRIGQTCVTAPGEVIYYPFSGQPKGPSVFPNFTEQVPITYGSTFSMETMAADTGWIASSEDLTKFISTMFGESPNRPVSKETFEDLLVWPANIPEWKSPKVLTFFAKGWQVVPPNRKHNQRVVYREGCLPGGIAVMMHRDDGISWSFAVNSRPMEFSKCQIELTQAIWHCVNAH